MLTGMFPLISVKVWIDISSSSLLSGNGLESQSNRASKSPDRAVKITKSEVKILIILAKGSASPRIPCRYPGLGGIAGASPSEEEPLEQDDVHGDEIK